MSVIEEADLMLKYARFMVGRIGWTGPGLTSTSPAKRSRHTRIKLCFLPSILRLRTMSELGLKIKMDGRRSRQQQIEEGGAGAQSGLESVK